MKKLAVISIIVVALAVGIFVIVKSSGNDDVDYKLVEVTRRFRSNPRSPE
jgi:hypothetical protein